MNNNDLKSRIEKRFDKEELWRIEKYSFEEILNYDERFNAEDIQMMIEIGCTNEVANRYDKRFDGMDIYFLTEAKCTPEQTRLYKNIYDGSDILSFVNVNLTLQQINSYNIGTTKRFTANEISELIRNDIPPKDALGYFKEYDSIDIICFKELGLTPASITIESQKNKYKLLKKLSNWRWTERENLEIPTDKILTQVTGKGYRLSYEFVAEGSTSIVLLRQVDEHKPQAYKFVIDGSAELKLLKKLNKRNKNVIRFYNGDHVTDPPTNLDQIFNPSDHIAVEYIRGKTLDRYLEEQTMEDKQVLKYSKETLHGLLELRHVGIYHRDINPKNVIIREKKNDAIIIDLGYATEDPHQYYLERDPDGKLHNRRFNGPNDLSSLGQLIFYMATGTSVFATAKEHKSDLSDIADEILDNRTKAYSNKIVLDSYLSRVGSKITDPALSNIIKECLTSGHNDYERIYSLVNNNIEKY